MPADSKQNTRRKQVRRKRAKPTGGPTNTAQSYVSQGKAVEKAANHQKRVKVKAKPAAPTKRQIKNADLQRREHVDQGRAVRRVAKLDKVLGPGAAPAGLRSYHRADIGSANRAQEFVSQGKAVEKRGDELGRQTRRYVKGQKGSGNIGRALKRELEGHGVLADVTGAVGGLAGRLPGNATGVQAAKMGGVPGIEGHRATRFAKDIANLPSAAVPAIYTPVAGVYEATVKHDSGRLKALGKSIDANDPVYNAGAAAVDAISGDSKGANKRLHAAVRAADEHPGFAAAEILGARGALGRGAGRVLRSGVAGSKLKDIAATTREPAVLEGTGIKQHREYSRDVITKGRQKLEEKHGTAGKRSNQVTVKEIHRRVDERVAVTGLDPFHFSGEFAARSPEGKVRLFTPSQVDAAARDLHERSGHEFVAQHAEQGGGRSVLIPKAALDRLMEHQHVMRGAKTTAEKVFQAGTGQFRRTVLATSPSWMTGNSLEAAGRGALNFAGPRSFITGHKALKRVGELDDASEASARIVAGGHIGTAERQRLTTTAEEFRDTHIEPLANAMHNVLSSPGPKQAVHAWNAWTHFAMDTVNGSIERAFQTSQFGRELRRSPLMEGHLLKTGSKAIDEAAHGLLDTNTQVAFGRAVDRAYGRYSKLSPSERYMISTYTPFWRWVANSWRFVVDVLPRDHPVAVGLTAALENSEDGWLKDKGLDQFAKGRVPAFLQGSIPTPGGGHLRLSRYLPLGAFTDPTGTLAEQVLPQASGVISAAEGRDWKGAKLYHKGGGEATIPDKALAAAHALATSTIPILGVGERVHEQGPSALNPLRVVKSKKKKKAKRRKSSAGGLKWDDGWNDGSSGGGTWGDG